MTYDALGAGALDYLRADIAHLSCFFVGLDDL